MEEATLAEVLDAVEEFETEEHSELGQRVSNVSSHSKEYIKEKKRLIASLTAFALSHPKWKKWMTKVPFGKGGEAYKLFADCAIFDGKYPAEKVQIANKLLVDYSLSMLQTNGSYFQPSTHVRKIRTLMAAMSEEYWWEYSIAMIGSQQLCLRRIHLRNL